MEDTDRDRLKKTFDANAPLYDAIRPRYPERLFEDIVELAGLGPEASVLEIGCGTGQATSALARRCGRIVCIELGDALAALARRNLAAFPEVSVVTAPFEHWEPDGSSFDLVLAATSWHWLDPRVRYAKAAEILEAEGALAIITSHHVLPGDGDRFFAEVQDDYRAIGEEDVPPPPPDAVADEGVDIEASGLFAGLLVTRYLWDRWYTADEYVALLDTYSGHRAMEPEVRRRLYDAVRRRIGARPGGRVRKHYLFILHLARPIGAGRR